MQTYSQSWKKLQKNEFGGGHMNTVIHLLWEDYSDIYKGNE